MQKFFAILLTAACTLSAGAQSAVDAFADSLASHRKIVHFGGTPADSASQIYVDSLRNVINGFFYDQFRHFQDPEAPYFLFMSKDAALAMGIGGAVRMRAYYDWGGAMPGPGFAPYLIPDQPDPTAMRHLGTTPAGSCLFFRVIGRNKKLGNYQVYIEANFNGYQARDFHLKKAYAIINDFTVGYATSTFADPAAVPPTVDAQGPNNKISPTSVLIRYMPVIKNKWVLGVSVESPQSVALTTDASTAAVDAWMPDFAGMVQYQWARGQHVRLSGIVRSMSYRDIPAAKNRTIEGWGLQLSCVAHPAYAVTTYATISYGHGYESLSGDLAMGKYDLMPKHDATGRLYAPKAMGWNVGLQYNFTPSLFASANVSHTRFMPDATMPPTEYKEGWCAAANIFWYMTPRMSVAAEFDWGLRRNQDGSTRHSQRIGALCQFSF